MAKQVQIKKADIPDGWPIEAADFANRLIQRKASLRLGFNGPEEVMTHPWLKDFPFDKLRKKELQSPFLPTVIYFPWIPWKNIDDNFEYRKLISVDNQESNEDLIRQN